MSEAELAWNWWTSSAHVVGGAAGDTQARRRVLLSVAQGLCDGQTLINVATQDAAAVATLIADGVLVQIATDRVKFVHDLFADWAIACSLFEDPQRINTLPLDALPPFWLNRGFELACRRLAEGDEKDAWPALIKDLEHRNAKSGWTALALLALVRSEHARTLLARHADLLLEGKGERAASLIRRVIASHGQPAETVLKKALPPGVAIPKGLILPAGPQWAELIVWCLGHIDRLPPAALAAATDPGTIPTLLNANRDWLIHANRRVDEDDDATDLERTWTRALFECAATRAKTWTDAQRGTRWCSTCSTIFQMRHSSIPPPRFSSKAI